MVDQLAHNYMVIGQEVAYRLVGTLRRLVLLLQVDSQEEAIGKYQQVVKSLQAYIEEVVQ